VDGVVWPQGSSGVRYLTKEERMRGLEVLAKARGQRTSLVFGVQGRDTAEMLEYARRADALSPDALIAMPPTTAKSLDEYLAYFRALGGATRRPVIIQTSGGAPSLVPTVDLIVSLAREFPHLGYVKEESQPIVERMKTELRQRPPLKAIFGANFGANWLYEMRLGLDGVITGNAMYADVMARMWTLHEKGDADALRELFGRFLLMRNLASRFPARISTSCASAGSSRPRRARRRRPEGAAVFRRRDCRDRIPIRGVDAVPDRHRQNGVI
jgi:Dihydrodipicolinate synthase/N-acetylneuraminate lyase